MLKICNKKTLWNQISTKINHQDVKKPFTSWWHEDVNGFLHPSGVFTEFSSHSCQITDFLTPGSLILWILRMIFVPFSEKVTCKNFLSLSPSWMSESSIDYQITKLPNFQIYSWYLFWFWAKYFWKKPKGQNPKMTVQFNLALLKNVWPKTKKISRINLEIWKFGNR